MAPNDNDTAGNAALTEAAVSRSEADADDPTVVIELEQPSLGSVLRARESLVGYGWALAETPVSAIRVELDGEHLCNAVIGLARTDVAELYAEHPGSARAGFTFVTHLPPRPSGVSALRLTVITAAGQHVRIVPLDIVGTAPIRAEALLGLPELPTLDGGPMVPPPETAPIRLELEDARVEVGGVLHVRGWAASLRPIGRVEIFADTHALGFADTALSRADVASAFPEYPNAALSGFSLSAALPDGAASIESVTAVVTDEGGDTLSANKPATGQGRGQGPAGGSRHDLEPMLLRLEEARINELGVLRVRGWVVSLSSVEQVRVFVGDQQLGTAAHNLPREDVGVAHADFPNATTSGFLLQVDVPDEQLVGQSLRVVATALGGIRREASAPVSAVPVIRRRDRGVAGIHFHCDSISLTEDGAVFIKGWAVCPSGTAAIEIDLGDDAVGQADLGEERPDVGNHFPQLPGARSAGFRFAGNCGARARGEQTFRLTVRGRDGESRTILQPVMAQPEAAAPKPDAKDAGIRFFLDSPRVKDGRAVEPVRGFLSLNGWAFSAAGITSVEVFVDGRSQGQAYRGIRREDLHATFGRKEALRSGFAMLVPPQLLKRGRHDLRVVIRDGAGYVEEVDFSLDVEPSMAGHGPWALRRKITEAERDLHLSMLPADTRPAWTLLLLPGAGTPAQAKRLLATLESLRWQAYPDWTAVIPVATAAEQVRLTELLGEDASGLHAGLRVVVVNATAPLAGLVSPCDRPRLLALLEAGDEVGEDALLELALAAASARGAEFLYSDERRIDPSDGATRAFFKPDWSPDLLLSTNYIGRLWATIPDLLERTGLQFGDLERHGEYDAVLRLTEQAASIAHVAKVLCARGSRTLDTPATERRALQRALARRAIEGEVRPGCLAGTWQVVRARTADPLVSIIIPTIAARGFIKIAINSIREKTGYRNFEIVCLDNIRDDAGVDGAVWKRWLGDNADVVVEIADRFNWSRFNNIGARHARGDVLLFLNDDIEITHKDWLDGLLEQAIRPEVGVVGPQLLYPDGNVQHAGMFLSRQVGRHAFRYSPSNEPGPFGLALTQRNVIAVTGACLMVRRDVFEELGGFDEEHSIINNDLDFCLRAWSSGRLTVYTPRVSLIHYEMVSRGEYKDIYNADRFDTAWKELFLKGDPYFNPNLSLDYDDYVPDEEPVRGVLIGHPVIARDIVKRIVAVKVDHIGDFIAAFPAFRRLKERFPNAELTVLAAQASLAIASLEPAIDRVIQYDFFHARSERGRRAVTRRDLQRLLEQLAPYRFDLAVDLRRQPDTRQILQFTGARWLAGFDAENRTEWLDIAVEWEGDVARTHKRTHISEALVQFVDAIAVACETDRRIIRSPADAATAKAYVSGMAELAALPGGLGPGPLVCLHTGAGSENKQWPLGSFASLADLLTTEQNATVVVIGGPDEEASVGQMLSLTRHRDRVVSVVGRLGLRDLPLLLTGCDLYVGNDSGPKHMAASLGVPTIGIHSGSVDSVEWGPLGPAAVAVRRETTCSPCYLAKVSDCHRGLACLNGIRVGDVYHHCQRMLKLPRAADRPAGARRETAPESLSQHRAE